MCKHTDTYISQVIQTENLTFCFLDSVFSTHQQKHENIVRHLCHAINKVEEWKEEAPKVCSSVLTQLRYLRHKVNTGITLNPYCREFQNRRVLQTVEYFW
jgi:methylphosphotriester-DNA--protein-cysteine methyltransferase